MKARTLHREPASANAAREALCARRAAFVSRLGALLLILFGCGADRVRDDGLQGASVRLGKEPSDQKAIRWALGAFADGDSAHNIVFRPRVCAKEPSKDHGPKAAIASPIIQGAAEALCVGEDRGTFVGGSFSGNLDFDTGRGRDFHEALGSEDGFVTRFDQDGKYCWTTTFGARGRVSVRGLAEINRVLYVACDESDGHVAVLAIDSKTGAPNTRFGVSGCQMFRCGDFDEAAGIRGQGEGIYIPVRCIYFPGGKWPSSSYTAVLAIDCRNGSAITTFGAGGIQTIGIPANSGASTTAPPFQRNSVEPLGVAVSQSRIYVVGKCSGSGFGIGGEGSIIADDTAQAFIAAIDRRLGVASAGFGKNGLVLLAENAMAATDAVVSRDSLFLTGHWRDPSTDVFVAKLDAGSGALAQQFGKAGLKLFGPWEWQGGHSIRVYGDVLYIAGGFIEQKTEGVFVAAFDQSNGLAIRSFGNNGTRMIEGLEFGDQGRIELFDDHLFLVAETAASLRDGRHVVTIGKIVLSTGGARGFLFRFSTNGEPERLRSDGARSTR